MSTEQDVQGGIFRGRARIHDLVQPLTEQDILRRLNERNAKFWARADSKHATAQAAAQDTTTKPEPITTLQTLNRFLSRFWKARTA